MHTLFTKVRSVTAHEFLGSIRQAARLCHVSKSSVANWVKKGTQVGEPPLRKVRASKLPNIDANILSILDAEPRCTLDHLSKCLSEVTNVTISRSHVHRTLRRLGFSNKITSQCWKKQVTDMAHPFFDDNPFGGEVISVDESGFCMASRPTRGWGRRGERVHRGKPARRKRISAIVAMSKSGFVAQQLVHGGVNGTTFAQFLETLPDDCKIILDNCSIHKAPIVRNTLTRKRIIPIFIPPYSPWFNPIENAFGQAKSHFRKARLEQGHLEDDVKESFSKVKGFEAMFRSSSDKWVSLATSGRKGLPISS